MPFVVRVGFVILAHLFVLVKYFFKLFSKLFRTSQVVPDCVALSLLQQLWYFIKVFRVCQVLFSSFWFRPRIVWMIPRLPVSLRFRCFCIFWRTSIFYRTRYTLSSTFSKKFAERRKRDLNPRAAVNDLLPFQGSPFGQLGYFSIKNGEGGIRTHAPFRTNGFQDRLVMTTSIPLHNT